MIYCVSFAEVETYLSTFGYVLVKRFDGTVRFENGSDILTIHAPNVNGHLPEILVNDALDNARLPCPSWEVFWCD